MKFPILKLTFLVVCWSQISVQSSQSWFQVPVSLYQKPLETNSFHKLLPDLKNQCQNSLTQAFALFCVAEIFQKLGNFKTCSIWDLCQGTMKLSPDKLNLQHISFKKVPFCQRYMSVYNVNYLIKFFLLEMVIFTLIKKYLAVCLLLHGILFAHLNAVLE